MEDAKKIWYKEAFEDGEERGLTTGLTTGRSQGKHVNLIELVQRKLLKGKTLEVIAEELEELLENVKRICEAAEQCGLDADPQEIYDKLQKMAPVQ